MCDYRSLRLKPHVPLQAVDDVLALFQSLPEADRAAILAGNSKIATTNAKVTAAILATIPTRPVHDRSDGNATLAPTMTITAPGTPSSAAKRKVTDTGDENSREQQSEEAGSSANANGQKPVGRPKKPVDPEKAAKVCLFEISFGRSLDEHVPFSGEREDGEEAGQGREGEERQGSPKSVKESYG